MAHYSHTELGGIRLTFGKRGIVFTRKANRFNRCVGDKMRKQSFASREAARSAFTSAAKGC